MQIESLQQLSDILLTKKMELQGVVEQLNEHHHDNGSNEVCCHDKLLDTSLKLFQTHQGDTGQQFQQRRRQLPRENAQ